MKRIVTILLLSVSLAALGQGYTLRDVAFVGTVATPATTVTPLTVDYYMTMTNGSIGSAMTVAILTNGTTPKVQGLWSSSGSGGMGLGGHTNNLLHPVLCNGTTFPVDFANQSLRITNTSTFRYAQFETTITSRKVTASGYIYLAPTNNSTTGGGLYDLVSIKGLNTGGFAIMQLNANGSGSSYYLNIESDPGGITTHSTHITVTPATWYWYSFKSDFTIGSNSLAIFDTSGNQVGSTVVSTNRSGEDIYPLRFGNAENGSSSGVNCFEHTMIAVGANAVQPLGP